mgnify:CR=1 FL=1
MFSIVVPTFNNIKYLKILIHSIKKNSKYNNEIIVHINEGTDGTIEYIKENNIKHTYSEKNVGLCSATNIAAKKASSNYILYSHDDMYFCPGWDAVLFDEISNLNTDAFYLSATMIEKSSGHIQFNCGNDYNDFDETKLLKEYKKLKFYDYQGSHWAPHLIHKKYWNLIGGFSEEFNPGIGSDPDLNMKLWKSGVRIFKGLSKFRVYHFGSIVLRKRKDFIRNKGARTFLIKWGVTPTFFLKFYLNAGTFVNGIIKSKKFDGPLNEPKKNISYHFNFFICKLKLIYLKIFNKDIK